MEGKGTTSVWASARAIDLLDKGNIHTEANVLNTFQSPDELPAFARKAAADSVKDERPPMHFLLLGTGDPACMLKTIAHMRRHGAPRIHFHVVEPQAPLFARHLMLLYAALDPSLNELNYDERAELYLELYGNLYLRDKTHAWLQSVVPDLIRIITDGKGALGKITDFEGLRYRDRDDIEFALKFWRTETTNASGSASPFALDVLWEHRMRKYYGVRYDSRENALDWDYHMKLRDKIPHMSKPEFASFRTHGMSFPVRDVAAPHPNRTLATVGALAVPASQVGAAASTRAVKWGYFSDVEAGPWPAWASDTEFRDLLKRANDAPTHGARAVATANVAATVREAWTGRADVPTTTNATGSVGGTGLQSLADLMQGITISFVDARVLAKRKFDAVVVGAAYAHRAADIMLRATDGDVSAPWVAVESARWILDLSPSQRGAYMEKVVESASANKTLALCGVQERAWIRADRKWEAVGGTWDWIVFEPPSASNPATAADDAVRSAMAASASSLPVAAPSAL